MYKAKKDTGNNNTCPWITEPTDKKLLQGAPKKNFLHYGRC